MVFSYTWLQSFFEKKLPSPKKLAAPLTMHSFEVKEVKKVGKDFALDIDVLPNRGPDCFSHLGIAREIAAILKSKLATPSFILPFQRRGRKEVGEFKNFLSIEVKDKNVCQRYSLKLVFDVNVASSPNWLQERLKTCGLQPINNIVDIANYVMVETGQPLHAFDFDKIESLKTTNQKSRLRQGFGLRPTKSPSADEVGGQAKIKKIIVRRAKKGEKIMALDNKEYKLDRNILVIADLKEPLAIAGIKGGRKAEIDENTKIVVLESANFNPKVIRHGSRKLNLKTDASWRFEHGIDPNLTEMAINRAASLIQEISHPPGGYPKIVQGLVDFYPKKVLPKKIKLDLDYAEGLLGVKIPRPKVIKILNSLGLKIENWKRKILNVVVPTFRLDISIPEDLIEEIARFYGYQKISAKPPKAILFPPRENPELLFEKKIKEIMKGYGFIESLNYSFISEKDYQFFENPKDVIEISNPTSASTKYLRPTLLSNLLKLASFNQKRFFEMAVFEVGKVYIKDSKGKPKERKMLGGFVSGKDKFFELKGYLEALFEKLGAKRYSFLPLKEALFGYFKKGESAKIVQGKKEIGFIGKISKDALDFYDLKISLFAFEINFKALFQIAKEKKKYLSPSPYPPAIRDIAVLVPAFTLAGGVLQKIQIAGGGQISKIEIFDVYQGPPLPPGKKNLAFRLFFQSGRKRFARKEVEDKIQKIIKILEKNKEWKVRRGNRASKQ